MTIYILGLNKNTMKLKALVFLILVIVIERSAQNSINLIKKYGDDYDVIKKGFPTPDNTTVCLNFIIKV